MLDLKNITKKYQKGRTEVTVLDRFAHSFDAGKFYAISGPSGAGKTTLMMILGGMLRPDSGTVLLNGTDLYSLSGIARNRIRRESIGCVFQKFHLLPYLTVLENIRLPLTLQTGHPDIDAPALAAAERLGLSDRLEHRPNELSVGQQQRVAIARVLAGNPEIILADEPTGNLDEANLRIISDCLCEEAARGKPVIAVTHEAALLSRADEIIRIHPVKP